MISIAEEDRDVLRFLWREDIKNELPRIQVLRFTCIVFGVSSSPFLLNATIKHHIRATRRETHNLSQSLSNPSTWMT